MSGNYEHLTNTQLSDMLHYYNLYATTKGVPDVVGPDGKIPGPVLLKLIQQRLKETDAPRGNAHPGLLSSPEQKELTFMGERLTPITD